MQETQNPRNHQELVAKSLEVTIKIGLALGLIVWCFYILKPFLMISLWGVIISVAVNPLYRWLGKKLGNRRKLAAVFVTLFLLLIILTPMIILGSSLGEAIRWIVATVEAKQSIIPPPSEAVRQWPLIGKQLFDIWQNASTNLAGFAGEHSAQLLEGLKWLMHSLAGAGIAVLLFLVSIIISGILLIFSEKAGKASVVFANRLLGPGGQQAVDNAEVTIRNVFRGILGVAFIQAVLAGLGFLVAGVPGAGLWALIGFFLCIIQIGLGPVMIPVLIYVFFTAKTTVFVLLLIWCIPVLLLDNVLKPVMMGRKSPAPMLVVLLGSIGGFIAFGIIGLFVGAVVLSFGYNMFLFWLHGSPAEPETREPLKNGESARDD